jgi:DNA-binding MarR family transcriptional regulator
VKKREKKTEGVAFLLAQVGAHAASKFAERIAPLGLVPAHAGILRVLRGSAGTSQQDLAHTLGIHPSRLVAIVDDLESRELVARRENPRDRRTYALHLTERGTDVLERLGQIALEHEESLCRSLARSERGVLGELLARVAEHEGLTPGVHPGYARLGGKARAPRSRKDA